MVPVPFMNSDTHYPVKEDKLLDIFSDKFLPGVAQVIFLRQF